MTTFRPLPVVLFLALSFGLAWLVALPLWLGDGIKHPYFTWIAIAIMWTPAIAALAVARFMERSADLPRSVGLQPWRPLGRTLLYSLGAALAALLISLASLAAGALFDVYAFDLQHLSGLDALLREKLAGREAALAALPPLHVVAALQVVLVFAAAPLNAVGALGEELGWRGWLLPRLMPLGTVPAILISGIAWGLWHAPVILLGYNYGATPSWLALACMCAMCIAVGAVLSWFTLRAASVWPAVIGHGAFNAAAGLYLVFGRAGQEIDPTVATPLGWTGWIFPALLALLLFHFTRHRHGTPAHV
ncbi:CPBP family intramembrane glutamic endopeptidase [Pseudoduganella sp. GCM10020061]|uniref:CPBP family intramembrane glutamic endopeptidase n=1 Tax=Pseudoduganella sp. GCM10020061 TaxID=3317345 RepID=UPI003634C765